MITSVEPCGMLVRDCSLTGEQKADSCFPAHPCGLPLSRDRWLILYATRALRGHDDDHSIIYQLRADAPDGHVLREGFLDRGSEEWDAFGDGKKYVRRTRHPMGFGVPKGAIVGGQGAANANAFVVQWCIEAAGKLDSTTGNVKYDTRPTGGFHSVLWCQFRLNDAHNDIEILQPAQTMRQAGFENGPAFCRVAGARTMIQSLVPTVPFNEDCTEWAITNHLGSAGIAAIKFRFRKETGLYEWVETGPCVPASDRYAFSEGSLVRADEGWVVCIRARRLNAAPPDWTGGTARDRGDTAWVRTADPFQDMPAAVVLQNPNRQAPVTAFRCADGVLRIFSGDLSNSPYRQRRDPLYCWDLNPVDFSVNNQRVVCDSIKDGMLVEDGALRSTCFGHVIPHMGGDTQYVAHRLMYFRYREGVDPTAPGITPDQLNRSGIAYVKLRYDKSYPSAWHFEQS